MRITENTTVSVPVMITLITVVIWAVRLEMRLEARIVANEKDITMIKSAVFGRRSRGDYDGD